MNGTGRSRADGGMVAAVSRHRYVLRGHASGKPASLGTPDRPEGAEPPISVDEGVAERELRDRILSAPSGIGRWLAAVACVALAAGLFVVLQVANEEQPPPSPPVLVTDDGPVLVHEGAHYQLGLPGDIAVIRTCDGQSHAWLLRPSTGAIYRFDVWAEEESATTRPIRMVADAVDLVLMRSLGCTDIHARTADGDSIPLTTGS